MSQTVAVPGPKVQMGVPIPNGKLGMWLFLGTEIMFFTAFIGTYIVLRMGSPGWPTDTNVTHIQVLLGGINTFVLICSSVSVVLAHEAMMKRNYTNAVRMMGLTLVLACVFLGIKMKEYHGKYVHDILPGHVAETDQQALDKMVRELDQASGLPAMRQEANTLSNRIAAASTESLTQQAKALDVKIKEQSAKFGVAFTKLREEAKSGSISLHDAETKLKALQDKHEELRGVHEPHPILYGNIFASTYFTMTGFHALHVILGMFFFLHIIYLGVKRKLGPQHNVLVENYGLYWHFVDLVWIFLFPLLYII